MHTIIQELAPPLRRFWRKFANRLTCRFFPWCKEAVIDAGIIAAFTAVFMGLWYYMFFIRKR